MTEPEYPLPLVDLRQFEDRYLIRATEEYDGPRKVPDDPFFQMIPCRAGMSIWAFGEAKLGATVQAKHVDKLLAAGLILKRESSICRDAPWRNDPKCVPPGVKPLHWQAQCRHLQAPRVADLVSFVVFPIEHLDAVAEIIGARKRRRMTPEQRAVATERLRRAREARFREEAARYTMPT
jgi:hypothetical protein